MQIHLVQPDSKGKVKFITITQEEYTLKKEWGKVDGKVQTKISTYKAKNVGKSNEITAEDSAINEFNKIVKKKEKEGYVITESLNDLPEFVDPFETLDLDNINTGFCCSKPTQTITEAGIDKIIKSGNSKIYVKYNGGCHYILIDSQSRVKIYTRRWDDHTTKYPDIVSEVKSRNFPPTTLIMVELCIDPALNIDHIKAFKLFSEISKTDTLNGKCKSSQKASMALQEAHKVKAAVLAYLYYGGEQLWHLPCGELLTIIKPFSQLSDGKLLFRPQGIVADSGSSLTNLAKIHKDKIEGFIIWDTSEPMEVTMNGKPKRKASWKVKVKGEAEVIAVSGEEGKVPGEYGSIHIGRYTVNDTFMPLGTVAGLKDEEKKPEWWNFPCVIEIKYDNIFPDTKHFQFGSFLKVHEDKTEYEVGRFEDL